MSLYAFGMNKDGQCGTSEDRSTPPTPSRGGGDITGSPQSGRFNEASAALRGEEPASIIVPRPVRLALRIRSVSAGSRHTLALTSDGAVYSWGWGAQGQLGLGHCSSVIFPTKIDNLSDPMVAISAGGIHSSCLDASGKCFTWGSNEYGQLGQGGAVPMSNTPAAVLCEDPAVTLLFSKIACGGMHSAAIDLTGHVWCWGRADSGQTGSGKWVFSHFPGLAYPKKIENVSGIIDVCCGGFHTTVLAENGRAMAMGKEDFGVLGTGIANSKQMKQGTETLTDIAALTDEKIVGISCGGWHSMFWTEDGKLYSCGKGEYGRLGLGNEENIPSPTLVTFEDPSVRVQSASCGGSHSLILTTDGRVFAVGRSDDGRLGLGSDLKPKIMTPYLVTPDTNVAFTVVQVVAGGAHSLVLVQHAGDVASTINPYPFIST